MSAEHALAAAKMTPVGWALAALDPGMSPALSLWCRHSEDEWQLFDVGRGHDKHADHDYLRRARQLAIDLRRFVNGRVRVASLVSEYPKTRRVGTTKSGADDLLPMALVIGCVASELDVEPDHCATMTPDEWAGNTPKATRGDPRLEVRGKRIYDALLLEEQQMLIQGNHHQHDKYDSIGVGLFATSRLRRGMVAPRRRQALSPSDNSDKV